MVKHDTLLICSSTPEKRQALRRIFSDTFHLLEAGDLDQLLRLLNQNLSCIAAVLVDISGQERAVAERIVQESDNEILQKVPAIVLVEQDTPQVLNRAFDLGAADVIPLDYDPTAMLHRVETIVDLNLHRRHLEVLVEEQKHILRHSYDTMVDALSTIIEYRSVESGQHVLRIRKFTRVLLEEVARCCPEYRLTDEIIDVICSASTLHDIGKIAIPDHVLTKPGKLTAEEWKIMKTHTLTGCRILEKLQKVPNPEYLRYAYNICRYHHERWDGSGYPDGLRGEAIPICAQVVGLADVYDALTSERVYKEAYSFSRAVNMIFRGECGVFSPKLLECFKHVAHQLEDLAAEYGDGKDPQQETFHAELPLPQLQSGDAMERIRGKYFALVHYINGLLIELDVDRKLFHLVYNPYPELSGLGEVDSLEQMRTQIYSRFVHPDDREKLAQILDEEIGRFLDKGLRRTSFRVRAVGDSPEGEPFELTLMRINPLDTTRRTLAVLVRKLRGEEQSRKTIGPAMVPLEGTFSCRNDADFTLIHLGSTRQRLSGYTAEEIREKFGNRLRELICPEDRDMVRREFTNQLKNGTQVRLEHRIVLKSGAVRWVYNQSDLVEDASGQEVIHSFLIDTQDLHREDAAMLDKLQRYEMILAQTENVLFEWDLVNDTIHMSDTWEKIFGYVPDKQIVETGAFLHPDDFPKLIDRIEALRNGSDYEMGEYRVAADSGRYLWCSFRGNAIRDHRGNLQKISGIIINVDAEKRAEQILQNRAEQDSLTRLLNKDAARKQAEAYFTRYALSAGGALLIIDLDNFKAVNDGHGHLFGDSVLVKTAQEIRKIFRGQDIVARIGGDEFLVVMRGVTDRMLVEQRCGRLIQTIANAFQSYKLPLSCSIGIALSPVHGQSYYELFQHADQALYRVKAAGKNSYAIYDPAEAGYMHHPGRTGLVINPIDSDHMPGLANDTIARYALRKLNSSRDKETSVNELLAFIGEQTKVSRVYVFENSDDNRFCSNTYEWCSEGISPEIDNLKNISYETDIPGYADNFDEEGIFYCPDVAILPKSVYDIVEPQGIKAMLHCAIRENGVFRGYIGFDDCRAPRLWTRDQIELLSFFSEILSNFLLRQRHLEAAQRQTREMRFILDNQNALIYVVAPESHTLRYVNARLQGKRPDVLPGMTCYRALEGRRTPCPNCPLEKLDGNRNHTCLVNGKDGRKNILLETACIRWDGEDACLISGRRIPEA